MAVLAGVIPRVPPAEAGSSGALPLTAGHEAEVLRFLAARPLHTVIMAGFVRDNGLVSTLNRGTFYACRDSEGRLEGVAFVGNVLMMEARSEAALRAFAQVAQHYNRARVILGEQGQVGRFWQHYAPAGQPKRLASRELLLELRWPVEAFTPVRLRPAEPGDLDQVAAANAQLAFEACGDDPMVTDPSGFRERTLRRIRRGRIWVLEERGRLIFKADVISDTPEAIYIEGVHVHPEERGRGLGTRCVSHLSRHLLRHAGSICLLVREQNLVAQSCYRKVGFTARSHYSTIYLQRNAPLQ